MLHVPNTARGLLHVWDEQMHFIFINQSAESCSLRHTSRCSPGSRSGDVLPTVAIETKSLTPQKHLLGLSENHFLGMQLLRKLSTWACSCACSCYISCPPGHTAVT